MQKHAIEVSRLKAAKERDRVGIARGEKVHACVGKKMPVSKRLFEMPSTKHDEAQLLEAWLFSLSRSEPTSLVTCHLQSISTGELPVDKTEVRGTMLTSFKPTSNI